jgi:NitT/TauT family transport system substrate-binding protein
MMGGFQMRSTWKILCGALVAIGLVAGTARSGAAAELQKLKFGFAGRAISPIIINILIPEILGYYKEEGLSVQGVPLGSNAAVVQNVVAGHVEFGAGNAPFQLPILARGEKLPVVNFFEFTYPFKYAWAVRPDSDIKSIADLKGKHVGVSNFGLAEYPIGQLLLEMQHIDPKKGVSWTAVGSGVTAGLALQRKDIDALFYFDTGFGTIEGAGIKLRYLPMPPNVPQIGGVFLSARTDTFKAHRDWAVGLGRAVAKAEVFIQTNPEAAAYLFVKMFPQAAPKGKTLEEQVKAIQISVNKRMPLYSPFDKSIKKWGFIKRGEWEDELRFSKFDNLKIGDIEGLFTNELIDEINNFDADKIRKQAKEFKLPYAAKSQ